MHVVNFIDNSRFLILRWVIAFFPYFDCYNMHSQGGISPSELTSVLVDFLESHSFDSLEASTVRHIDTTSREDHNYDGSDGPNIKGTEETNGNIKEEVIIPTTSNSPLSTDMEASTVRYVNALARAEDPSVEWVYPPPGHLSFPGSFF